MSDTQMDPPRWAHALLKSFVRPSDTESIPGDLLEEYREVKRPLLGRRRADAWYVKQAFSVLWSVVWPCVVAIAVLRILSFPLPRGWNPSLVPAPGASLLDALVFLWAGYYGSQRNGRLSTGIVTATVTSVLGFTTFFIYAAITRPALLLAPFANPFIFVIMTVLLAIAVTFGIVAGMAGAAAGRWFPPSRWRTRLS
ncbi:MAG TPA: permease prefix domain 2-containing transporter [Vicinamibacterales bacterium]|jgi:hypothetical protein|nr:permease prefix domain 2-containing transporter [Vicinamibacterales bacterium]